MNSHTPLVLLLLGLLFLHQTLFATIALTEEERSYIATRGPVRSISIDGSGPLQYTDSQGQMRGIAFQILDEISNRTGLSFATTMYGQIVQVGAAFTDGSDMIFGLPEQYARKGYVLSIPMVRSETIFFANTSIQPQELQGKRFAAVYKSVLPEGVSEDQARYYESLQEAILAVNSGSADYGYGNPFSLAFYTLQYGLRNIYTIPQGREERAYRILFLKDDPLLVSIINKALASFSPQELQNMILEATSQVERIITPAMIMDTYGGEIFTLTLVIILILVAALTHILFSRSKLDLEQRKFKAIAEVSNEYLFEYEAVRKHLILYERFRTLFTSPSSLEKARETLAKHLAKSEEGSLLALELPDGTTGYFKVSATKVLVRKRYAQLWVGKLQDISKETERLNYLENLAQLDGLTGLLNAATTRRIIETRLEQKHLEEMDACILFDIDDFKAVNDKLGHLAGDKVLQALATIMLENPCSSQDILGRIGGDEFCAYLVGIPSQEAALHYCTTLLEAVRTTLHTEGVTISLGFAMVVGLQTFEKLYTQVDQAMYRAKENGKDRIEVASQT